MNWRTGLKENIKAVSIRDTKYASSYNFESLLSQIGNREAIVDACLPPQLVHELRRNNVNAIWVPSVLGDGASDEEIERQLLITKSQTQDKVLLTRDVEFYRKVKCKAILVRHRQKLWMDSN